MSGSSAGGHEGLSDGALFGKVLEAVSIQTASADLAELALEGLKDGLCAAITRAEAVKLVTGEGPSVGAQGDEKWPVRLAAGSGGVRLGVASERGLAACRYSLGVLAAQRLQRVASKLTGAELAAAMRVWWASVKPALEKVEDAVLLACASASSAPALAPAGVLSEGNSHGAAPVLESAAGVKGTPVCQGGQT